MNNVNIETRINKVLQFFSTAPETVVADAIIKNKCSFDKIIAEALLSYEKDKILIGLTTLNKFSENDAFYRENIVLETMKTLQQCINLYMPNSDMHVVVHEIFQVIVIIVERINSIQPIREVFNYNELYAFILTNISSEVDMEIKISAMTIFLNVKPILDHPIVLILVQKTCDTMLDCLKIEKFKKVAWYQLIQLTAHILSNSAVKKLRPIALYNLNEKILPFLHEKNNSAIRMTVYTHLVLGINRIYSDRRNEPQDELTEILISHNLLIELISFSKSLNTHSIRIEGNYDPIEISTNCVNICARIVLWLAKKTFHLQARDSFLLSIKNELGNLNYSIGMWRYHLLHEPMENALLTMFYFIYIADECQEFTKHFALLDIIVNVINKSKENPESPHRLKMLWLLLSIELQNASKEQRNNRNVTIANELLIANLTKQRDLKCFITYHYDQLAWTFSEKNPMRLKTTVLILWVVNEFEKLKRLFFQKFRSGSIAISVYKHFLITIPVLPKIFDEKILEIVNELIDKEVEARKMLTEYYFNLMLHFHGDDITIKAIIKITTLMVMPHESDLYSVGKVLTQFVSKLQLCSHNEQAISSSFKYCSELLAVVHQGQTNPEFCLRFLTDYQFMSAIELAIGSDQKLNSELFEEAINLLHQLNKLYCRIIASRVAEIPKKQYLNVPEIILNCNKTDLIRKMLKMILTVLYCGNMTFIVLFDDEPTTIDITYFALAKLFFVTGIDVEKLKKYLYKILSILMDLYPFLRKLPINKDILKIQSKLLVNRHYALQYGAFRDNLDSKCCIANRK